MFYLLFHFYYHHYFVEKPLQLLPVYSVPPLIGLKLPPLLFLLRRILFSLKPTVYLRLHAVDKKKIKLFF